MISGRCLNPAFCVFCGRRIAPAYKPSIRCEDCFALRAERFGGQSQRAGGRVKSPGQLRLRSFVATTSGSYRQ